MTDNPSEDWWKTIGRRLKEVREKKLRTSQRQLGAPFGLGQDAISEIERGLRRELSEEVAQLFETHLGSMKKLGLAELTGPDAGDDPPELQHALALVRQLYRLKSHKPPYREHDWKVLMALLEAPAESDRDRERRRTRKE
jgi:hypothetical protein